MTGITDCVKVVIPGYQHIWDPLIAQVAKKEAGANVFLLRLNVAF